MLQNNVSLNWKPEPQEDNSGDTEMITLSPPVFRYGLMTQMDMSVLELVMSRICHDFSHINEINTCEIGVHAGDTSRGMRDFFRSKGVNHHHTGIDNRRDFKMNTPFPECKFILGNSSEVYNQVADNSIHFLFIDGCHNFPMTVADFLCYSDKIVPGGYVVFHDTGKHIPAFKDYQGMGNKADKDMFIACRRAVQKLGLYDGRFDGWELVLDEADESFETGGITVVRRVK